jgi:cyclophilin family peptidyl-prolyl cis-trans isomerase
MDRNLGQCGDIQDWNGAGLRLRPQSCHLEPNLHNCGNSGSRRILSMARSGNHRSTQKSQFQTPTASKPADVFAFAMLAVEVFSGRVPFGNMKNESVVIQIASGKRPAKPQAAEQLGLTAEMWKFIEKCWNANPSKRPTIDEVVSAWEGFVNGYVPSSFGSPTSQCITSRDNSRTSASKASERRSKFAEPSTIYTEKPSKTR